MFALDIGTCIVVVIGVTNHRGGNQLNGLHPSRACGPLNLDFVQPIRHASSDVMQRFVKPILFHRFAIFVSVRKWDGVLMLLVVLRNRHRASLAPHDCECDLLCEEAADWI